MNPKEFFYTEEHEWLKVEDDECTLGITDFAQKELGEVVYVELPNVGDTYDEEGAEIGTIESVKAVAEVYTPVPGEIIEINEKLEDEPELVNEDPLDKGWLVKLRIAPGTDFSGLMDAYAYEEFAGQGD